MPVVSERTVDTVFRESMARSSFTLGMALLLGVTGIYGVISYSVSQRTRELGIRMALGARTGELRLMVVRHGLLLAGIGTLAGLAGAAAVTRVMTSLLFETSPLDPITFALATLALLAAAAVASYLPAHRASTINPVEALRME